MNSPHKVLLIDSADDRKQRIKALSERGYTVFPALRMEEARSRCMRGAYDLIVVHAGNEQQRALEFCDEVRQQCPKQLLLLSGDGGSGRDYAVADDMQALLKRVDALLPNNKTNADMASAA